MFEHLRHTKHICLQLYVCDEVTLTGGVYGLHRLKGPCKEQVFSYEALTLLECLCVFKYNLRGM